MKLYKKNKGLLISICTISIVALATVGFSTWILGINDPVKDVDNIKVEIDTHKDRTCALEIKTKEATPTLRLSENISKDITNNADTGFGYKFDETTPAKFDIQLDYFNFAFPKDNAKFESITFTTTFTNGEVDNPNSPKSNEFGRTGTDLKYIEFVTEDITPTNLKDKTKLTEVGSYNYYSLKDTKLSFKWGNYYVESYDEGKKATDSPATYYQLQLDKVKEEFKGKEKLEKQLDVLSKAKTEFEALDNALKGATINLNITLNVTFTD